MNRLLLFLPQTSSAVFLFSSNDTEQVCVSLLLMGQQPYSVLGHGLAMPVLSKNIRISLCKGVSIFSGTSNGFDILSPSTFLMVWLKPLGTFGEIFNAQVTLCFDFGDSYPLTALLTHSLSGSKGVEDEQGLSVEEFMVLANSSFICLFICCLRVLNFLFIGVFSFSIPASFTTLLVCRFLWFFTLSFSLYLSGTFGSSSLFLAIYTAFSFVLSLSFSFISKWSALLL